MSASIFPSSTEFYIGVAFTLAIFLILFTVFEPVVNFILGPKYTALESGHGIVVITGSSSGIGLDASIALADQGYYVFACVRKDADYEKIKKMNKENLYPLILDVNKHDTIREAYKVVQSKCIETGLPFAGLVNNAGVSFSSPAEFSEEKDIRWLFETNFFGVAFTTKEFLPLIRKHKSRIIIVGSVLGILGQPGLSFYSASKFAVRGYAESLRLEMQMHGVSVSLIEPGYIRTKIIEKTLESVNQNTSENEQLEKDYPRLYSDVTIELRKQEMEYSSDTTVSSKAITHAMMSSRPLTRYPISNIGVLPVSFVSFLRRIYSDRALDWYTLNFKYPVVKQRDQCTKNILGENQMKEETKTI